MPNLAIECSGQLFGVGIFADRNQASNHQRTSSGQELAKTIQELLRQPELSSQSQSSPVDFISVSVGPGSFTGLRIGLATAKMLALAWQIPVVPVDTLQVIAAQANWRSVEPQPDSLRKASSAENTSSPRTTGSARYASSAEKTDKERVIVPVLNAFRGQVFTATWCWTDGGLGSCLREACVRDATAWQDDPVDGIDAEVIVTGPGLDKFSPAPTVKIQTTSSDCWAPRVATLARIGFERFQAGHSCDARELLPNYVRASAAEEKLQRNISHD